MTTNFDNYSDILILSGAGFGIDAGLPDYNGMHQMADEAAAVHNIEPYMIEHPSFYEQNPAGAWGMKARVMNIFLTKKPHEGYHILKKLTENKNLFVITSNIDDHFRTAGFDGSKLYEIHGRLKILQCTDRKCNQHHNLWPLDYLPQEENMTLIGEPPRCIYCGKCARPNVCFTDDNSFCNKLRLAQQASFKKWIKMVSSRRKPKLLVLELGCGRHKDSIGMQKLDNGRFRVLSKELQFPDNLNEENMKIIRVNPDKNIPKESWEEVYYTTGLKFFQKIK